MVVGWGSTSRRLRASVRDSFGDDGLAGAVAVGVEVAQAAAAAAAAANPDP